MRIYGIGLLLLTVAFLSFYVPARFDQEARFQTEGPGFLAQQAPDLTVSWTPDDAGRRPSVAFLKKQSVVREIVTVLDPQFGGWTEMAVPPTGTFYLTFYSREHLRRVQVLIGKNYAVCGPYMKPLTSKVVAQIRKQLYYASEIVEFPNRA